MGLLLFGLITIFHPLVSIVEVTMCGKVAIFVYSCFIEPTITTVSFSLAVGSYKSAFVVSVERTTVIVSVANRVILSGLVMLAVASGVGWFFAFENGQSFPGRGKPIDCLLDDLLFLS